MDDSPLQVGLCSNNKPIDTYQAGCDIMSGNYFILCRTNKQVKSIQDLGFTNVSTVHQAKGLEYDNVLMTDIEVHDNEDLNIAYVAATRARNKLMVMNYNMLYRFLLLYRSEHPSAF
jgi:superfamily I DNA/RNA helicase